ncbi:MAG: DUF3592 domain-containing protein [Ruminococcus sp.]|nr:DUF3592 domain-containing protein [Ruminococcus sp.]
MCFKNIIKKILRAVAVIIITEFFIVLSGLLLFKGDDFYDDFFFYFSFMSLDSYLFFMMFYVIKCMRPIVRLKKIGCRTVGRITEITSYGRGGVCKIEFKADEKTYECKTGYVSSSLKKGMEVNVLYDKNNPDNSCVDKHDMFAWCCFAVGTGSLLIFFIAATVYILKML